ncbi:PadR family transcriptional regulator [Halioglobus pacificus]|uniref:PadR family transcriptional regulator n=2 Tax=Parahalioglobus pacificus TaxID=930806 RepID=A0A918XE39_9GAMM|nr:PadR family transcriptional regulator [Halioglobus pacificus]
MQFIAYKNYVQVFAYIFRWDTLAAIRHNNARNPMALAHAIMTALIDDDLSGYELAKSFDVSLGFFWRASHQQIYQELRKLAERGLLRGEKVSQSGKPNKIIYGLTEEGREALAQWVYDSSRMQEAKDDMLVKLYNLGDDNISHMVSEIEKRRDEMMQRLYLYERIRRTHYAKPDVLPVRRQGVYLALRCGITGGEQFLAWCDEALKRLAQIQSAQA